MAQGTQEDSRNSPRRRMKIRIRYSQEEKMKDKAPKRMAMIRGRRPLNSRAR